MLSQTQRGDSMTSARLFWVLFYDAPSFLVFYGSMLQGLYRDAVSSENLATQHLFRTDQQQAVLILCARECSSPRPLASSCVREIKTVRVLSLSEPHLNWLWSLWLLSEAEWFDQHAPVSMEQCGSNLGFMFVDCVPLLVLVYLVRYNQQQLLFRMNILFSNHFSWSLEISWLAARILVHIHCRSISFCRLQITVATALSTWCGSVFDHQCLIDLLWGPDQLWALLDLLASVWEFLLRQLLTYNMCVSGQRLVYATEVVPPILMA